MCPLIQRLNQEYKTHALAINHGNKKVVAIYFCIRLLDYNFI